MQKRQYNIIWESGVIILLRSEIMDKLNEIFIRRFDTNLPSDIGAEKDFDLLEKGMTPGYLLYLYNDIEKEFQIEIPEEDIHNRNFSTINNIVDIVLRQMENGNEG